MSSHPKSVIWHEGVVHLLDQTLLPHQEIVLPCRDIETVFEAIQKLRVRGAPAIGVTAAYGLIVGLGNTTSITKLKIRAEYLISARPTAVNLAWAVTRMMDRALAQARDNLVDVRELIAEAQLIHAEDIEACLAIGEFGMPLVAKHPNLLTHCNAGALAVSELGTALAPIYVAKEAGIDVHVFVDETRPLLQGARLTAYELDCNNIPNTLICDNMAAHVMSLGKVDAVIVGADRVALNGDAANKVGTLGLAILCQHFKIPFYVACPVSTIDFETASGRQIVIEERNSEEITHISGTRVSSANQVFNPAFDVTPAALVTALITNLGLVEYPNEAKLLALGGKHPT